MTAPTERNGLNSIIARGYPKIHCSPLCRAASVAGSVAVIATGAGIIYGSVVNSSAPYHALKIGAGLFFGGDAMLIGACFLTMAIYDCKKPKPDAPINEV